MNNTTQTTATPETTTAAPAAPVSAPAVKAGINWGGIGKKVGLFALGAAVGAGAYYAFEKFVSKTAEVVVDTIVG